MTETTEKAGDAATMLSMLICLFLIPFVSPARSVALALVFLAFMIETIVKRVMVFLNDRGRV